MASRTGEVKSAPVWLALICTAKITLSSASGASSPRRGRRLIPWTAANTQMPALATATRRKAPSSGGIDSSTTLIATGFNPRIVAIDTQARMEASPRGWEFSRGLDAILGRPGRRERVSPAATRPAVRLRRRPDA